MTTVSIDVDAATSVVSGVREFRRVARSERDAARGEASAAQCSTSAVDGLEEQLDTLDRLADDLESRVTLAVLANTGDLRPSAPGQVYSFTVDGDDSTQAVHLALGRQLGRNLSGLEGDLKRYADGVDADEDGKKDALPPELANRLASYVTLLEKYQGDGPVSTGLLMELGADGYLALPATVERALLRDHPDATFPDGTTLEDRGLEQRFIKAYGSVLATGVTWDRTHGPDLPYGAVAGLTTQYLPDDFGRHLAQSAFDHRGDGNGYGLGQVLRFGTYPKEFLLDVGNRLDQIEVEWTKEHGDQPLWGGSLSTLDLDIGSLGTEDEGGHHDPFVGLFEAMGRTPPAAADFFNPDAGGDVAKRRATYFIKERRWSHDDFNALGMALDAGGTVYHVPYRGDPADAEALAAWRTRAEQSAWLTSAALDALGGRDEGRNHRRIGEDGKDSLAHLLAAYMPDIDRVADGTDGTTVGVINPTEAWAAGAPPGALMEVGDLRAVLGEVLTDRDAAAYFGDRTAAYNASRISAMASYHDDGSTKFSDAVRRSGSLQGFALSVMGAELKERAGDAGDNVAAFLTTASNGVGMVPVAGPYLTFFVDGALDGGGPDSLRQRWTKLEEDQVTKNNTILWNAEATLKNQVGLALQQAGAIKSPYTAAQVDGDVVKRQEFASWLTGGNVPQPVGGLLSDLGSSFDHGVKAGQGS